MRVVPTIVHLGWAWHPREGPYPAGDGAPEASYSLVSGHHKPEGPPKGIEMKRFTT